MACTVVLKVVLPAKLNNRYFESLISFFFSTQTICQKTPDKTAEYFAAVWALYAISKVEMLRTAHLNDLKALSAPHMEVEYEVDVFLRS